MAELIVITGGAYSGKTAVIRELAARGYPVIHEAAFEVIEELVDEHGVEEQIEWRRRNQQKFQRRLSLRQHARETAARGSDAPFVFSDRGFLDGMVYCRMGGVEWPDELRTLSDAARYAHVFVLATLSSFDPRRDTGRDDRRKDAVRITALLEEAYRPVCGGITPVPEMPAADRVDLVLRTLGLPPTSDSGETCSGG